MTKLLEKALAEVSQLSSDEQDAVARWLLAELESEHRWTDLLAGSQDHLAELADEALAEHRAGRTKPLDANRW